MNLTILHPTVFTDEQQALVNKARRAVAELNRTFSAEVSGAPFSLHAEALVHPPLGDRPLRLDFHAVDDRHPFSAFVGPDVPLTDEIFAGNALKPEVLEQFEAGCTDFEQHLKS